MLQSSGTGPFFYLLSIHMQVLYEDNHIIVGSKAAGEIVQGDKTGDKTLCDEVKAYIKEQYAKPGEVYLGVTHRLDRPVSGLVVFARTSKGLSRMNELFRLGQVAKTYLAIVERRPPEDEGELADWLVRIEKQNKSYVVPGQRGEAKLARLRYRLLATSDRYFLLGVRLLTGRHHQIRCQLSHMGCPIKGDLKYGARRSNSDGSISLHAWHIAFEHPVSHKTISLFAPLPGGNLWQSFRSQLDESAAPEI